MPNHSRYENGVIYPPYHLEVIACDHCNIRCVQCNHGSPAMARWFADPESVYRDLSMIRPFYRPPFIKVLGGEPLLHKNLVGLLEAVREVAIAPSIRLVTNGLLLGRMPDKAWPLIDVLEISIYPGQNIPTEALDKARRSVPEVMELRHDEFRETFAALGSRDNQFIRRVYSACKLANLWGCHCVREGYFYKCPQSIYLSQNEPANLVHDRIALDGSADLPSRILQFVNSTEPLLSCRFCSGTSGKYRANHQRIDKADWLQANQKTLEEIVDLAEVANVEKLHFIDPKARRAATSG